MSERLKYSRFIWFHGQVKAEAFPNARRLAEHFEISQRTAQRDIEFMRDRLNAPLEYSSTYKGYYYRSRYYELPTLSLNEENIIALALAVRLASSIPEKNMKKGLCALVDEILGRTDIADLCSADIARLVSIKNVEYYRVSSPHFPAITNALFKKRPVKIIYHSPHQAATTTRIIFPLHLLLYMGSWHLIAWCTLKKELRDFVLSRIETVVPYDGILRLPKGIPSVKGYVRRNFGIMQGRSRVNVKLKFSPSVAAWVREQVWHQAQKMIINKKDGSLILSFPVADLREITRRVLFYGADVKVHSPKLLLEAVKKEINRMANLYRSKDL